MPRNLHFRQLPIKFTKMKLCHPRPQRVASLVAVGDHWISWLYQAFVISSYVNHRLASNPAHCLRKAPLLTYLWLPFTPRSHELTIPRALACGKRGNKVRHHRVDRIIFHKNLNVEIWSFIHWWLGVWKWQHLARLESNGAAATLNSQVTWTPSRNRNQGPCKEAQLHKEINQRRSEKENGIIWRETERVIFLEIFQHLWGATVLFVIG